jgi:HIV Tat-specific factor 1
MEDEDFRRQLELEAEEAKAREAGTPSIAASNPYLYTDPTGTVYEWNHEKKAWFPKIDDNFIAQYQASYGFTEATSAETHQEDKNEPTRNSSKGQETEEPSASNSGDAVNDEQIDEEEEPTEQIQGNKRKKELPTASWFEVDDDHNTNVYVSNLPTDITEEEFVTFMSKCGLVMKDLHTNKYKVKLYRDSDGKLKGDALCTFIKVESVDLALQLLDESDFKGQLIKVERAKFTLKGEYDPNKRPKRKKNDKKKMQKKLEKLFDWRPDKLPFERSKSEMTVVIKNLFNISDFAQDPRLILEYRADVREECMEKCGPVKKVDVYDNNPEGVALVHFGDFESADKCVALMNGRFFAGRKLTAENWNGKARYRINETEEEAEKRMKEWDNFLQQT